MDSNICPAATYGDDFPGATVVAMMLIGIFIEYVILPCCRKPEKTVRITHECGYTEIKTIKN